MLLTRDERIALNHVIDYHNYAISENLAKIRKLSDEVKESKILLRLAKGLKEEI